MSVKKHSSQRLISDNMMGYLMIAPSYIVYAGFVLIPILWTIFTSFTAYDLKSYTLIGLSNYLKLIEDEVFIQSIGNTIYYSILTIPPVMILSFLLALLLNRKVMGRGIFRTVFYLPNILSMVAIAMAWSYLLNAQAGIFNIALRRIGFETIKWLTDPRIAMVSIAMMSVWASLGYYAILNLSGLQNIPNYLYEAAQIDGANKLQQLFHITIPQMRPTTFFIMVMSFIQSFQVFGQVFILTQGGPLNATTTIAHQIYRNGFEYYQMGYASAEAVILLLLILSITILNMRSGRVGQA